MTSGSKKDILDDLLKGLADDDSHAEPAISRLINRFVEAQEQEEKPPAGETSRPKARSQAKAHGPADKRKLTHYLTGEISTDLDEAREKINDLVHRQIKAELSSMPTQKELAPSGHKTRISKSRIVDQALRMILAEFEEKGEKSQLFKEIIKGSRKK